MHTRSLSDFRFPFICCAITVQRTSRLSEFLRRVSLRDVGGRVANDRRRVYARPSSFGRSLARAFTVGGVSLLPACEGKSAASRVNRDRNVKTAAWKAPRFSNSGRYNENTSAKRNAKAATWKVRGKPQNRDYLADERTRASLSRRKGGNGTSDQAVRSRISV